ncbi:cytochrome oxidase assembly protein 1 [Gorgonomyces haynaldii]|nr:cytochrome oxidase assembly protein 1 [Gorgonomyces haynaldii]
MATQKIGRLLQQPALVGTLLLSGLGFWYYQINKSVQNQLTHNTLFRGIMYHLNQHQEASQLLGLPIKHNELVPAKGHCNVIKGDADLEFTVTGSLSEAIVQFKGNRVKNSDFWQSSVFTVKAKDQELRIE